MTNIILGIQEKLKEITALKHIGKNWGELQNEELQIELPCALLEITNVDYLQAGNLAQTANATIEITIANDQPETSTEEESNTVFDIIEKIHQLLHGWSDGEFQMLTRTNLRKAEAPQGYEIYKINYQTAWQVYKEMNVKEVTLKDIKRKKEEEKNKERDENSPTKNSFCIIPTFN